MCFADNRLVNVRNTAPNSWQYASSHSRNILLIVLDDVSRQMAIAFCAVKNRSSRFGRLIVRMLRVKVEIVRLCWYTAGGQILGAYGGTLVESDRATVLNSDARWL